MPMRRSQTPPRPSRPLPSMYIIFVSHVISVMTLSVIRKNKEQQRELTATPVKKSGKFTPSRTPAQGYRKTPFPDRGATSSKKRPATAGSSDVETDMMYVHFLYGYVALTLMLISTSATCPPARR